jgi:hypothetical protein
VLDAVMSFSLVLDKLRLRTQIRSRDSFRALLSRGVAPAELHGNKIKFVDFLVIAIPAL